MPKPIFCGLDEHQHGEACYDDEGNLICTLEEHTHTEACLAQKAQQEEETEQTLTAQVNDATISVTFPTDALPEGVVLQAQEIAQDSEDYAAYYQQALQAMQEQAETELTLSFARFFDINFLADGAEVEPTAPVAVTITYADGIALVGNEKQRRRTLYRRWYSSAGCADRRLRRYSRHLHLYPGQLFSNRHGVGLRCFQLCGGSSS